MKPCQREIHGVRSFLVGLTYQINAELMAAVTVSLPKHLNLAVTNCFQQSLIIPFVLIGVSQGEI